jgi:enoyl-CoA hydratase/carnithine racemase
MADDLLFAVKDKVAVMTLNRPEALNAFTPDILTAWVARLEEAQQRDDVNVLLVTGAGRGFSSGGDVSTVCGHRPRSSPNAGWNSTSRRLRPLTASLLGVGSTSR